jgi:integrase
MILCYDNMASVNKDPRGRSPFWYACYTSAEGVRKRESTEQTDKRIAQKVADAKQRAENERRKGTISTQRIVDLLNDTLRSAGLEQITTIRLKNWLEEWLEAKRNISPASRLGYEQAVREFLEFMGTRQTGPLESVSERDIDRFIDHLSKGGRGAGTINKLVRKYLSGAFEKARKLGKIKYNPVSATDPLEHKSIVKDRFTPEQVARLVAVADPDWAGMVLFGYGCGARLQDAANLRWSDLDLENGLVTFTERKTDREAIIGLHPDFEEWLLESKGTPEDPNGFVFPTLANRTGAGRNGLSKAFERLMDKAGIESKVLKAGKGTGRNIRALSYHSLRHGAASSVFNSEAIKEVQRRVTNHARGGVLDRYTHQDVALIKAAVELIPRLPRK